MSCDSTEEVAAIAAVCSESECTYHVYKDSELCSQHYILRFGSEEERKRLADIAAASVTVDETELFDFARRDEDADTMPFSDIKTIVTEGSLYKLHDLVSLRKNVSFFTSDECVELLNCCRHHQDAIRFGLYAVIVYLTVDYYNLKEKTKDMPASARSDIASTLCYIGGFGDTRPRSIEAWMEYKENARYWVSKDVRGAMDFLQSELAKEKQCFVCLKNLAEENREDVQYIPCCGQMCHKACATAGVVVRGRCVCCRSVK